MGKESVYNPILRWAGGKRWLIPKIVELTESMKFNDYHEPFIGGGSIAFNIRTTNKKYISDINPNLINFYKIVKKEPNELIELLLKYKNSEKFYYKIRSQKTDDPLVRAANFFFLNRTSFNGLYRENLKGEYNVPYGHRQLMKEDILKLLHLNSKLKNTIITCQPYELSLKGPKKGDLVYIDPPYTVAHENNGFIKYNRKLFAYEDQIMLVQIIQELDKRGVYVILSNAKHASISKIYSKFSKPSIISRHSIIGGKNAHRGKISEFLFTNLI
ncbi:DNA adenine methylase [Leptospira paudalimensis]|uniref:Site-specific DNA-methyltransferase (adenine-specific) n=1 Tax=Leptospira paudalimensis TaxID=2950024 RepID=A0ABT3M5B2_9LEPT|nr:Dam family site-specific DNA-(adenine-N6)-methyltransferase [Leptospira paudalimensis]MCW7503580.1 Dam family site-specific DNA-(adenine-N6)-methyltransferase [Leptospira paudalimensis]